MNGLKIISCCRTLRCLVLVAAVVCPLFLQAGEEGIPFILNYPSEVYKAHDRNFEVDCDRHGNTYFANFEGVAVYNNTSWKVITTPDICRITSLYVNDRNGIVWVGGYNSVGKMVVTANGSLEYQPIVLASDLKKERLGEVLNIFQNGDQTYFVGQEALLLVKGDSVDRVVEFPCKADYSFPLLDKELFQGDDGYFYEITDGEVRRLHMAQLPSGEKLTNSCKLNEEECLLGSTRGLYLWRNGILSAVGEKRIHDQHITCIKRLSDESIVLATTTDGLFQLDKNFRIQRHITEKNGLINDGVEWIDEDRKGVVWCATRKGISAILFSSYASRYTEREGLMGEVQTIVRNHGNLYVGTYRGLFIYNAQAGVFEAIPEISQSCWNLVEAHDGNLVAVTGSGLYRVAGKRVKLLNPSFALSAYPLKNGDEWVVSGMEQLIKVPFRTPDKIDPMVSVPQVVKMAEVDNALWCENVFGEIFQVDIGTNEVLQLTENIGLPYRQGNKFQVIDNRVVIISRDGFYRWNPSKMAVEPYNLIEVAGQSLDWWPGYMGISKNGSLWITRGDGRQISVFNKDGSPDVESSRKVYSLNDIPVRLIDFDEDGVVWLGGGNGLIRVDLEAHPRSYQTPPEVYIRSISVKDSLIYNGHMVDDSLFNQSNLPFTPVFTSRMRDIHFEFAPSALANMNVVEYSYRLVGYDDKWSNWSSGTDCDYKNLPYKSYIFEVKLKDAFNRESEPRSFMFTVAEPIYLKWYSYLFYLLIWMWLMYLLFRWRTRRLVMERERLEKVVEQRTSEVRQQRDEIQAKSQELEKTLDELARTQNTLVQQEKMAMVGKLTQGLVDRILNPINYINNFSALTASFVKDLKETVEEEKENFGEEVYDDLDELTQLMQTNLEKILAHGQSVSRILKSMEEMLRERSTVFSTIDLNELCRVSLDVFRKHNQEELSRFRIITELVPLPEGIYIEGHSESLGKMFASILQNALYAVTKKSERGEYDLKITISVSRKDEMACVSVRDNGIGIESTIVEKIFDPYFTTKTTAEAAGVGLYFSREVVYNHQGTMSVQSEKDEFAEFRMMFPIKH